MSSIPVMLLFRASRDGLLLLKSVPNPAKDRIVTNFPRPKAGDPGPKPPTGRAPTVKNGAGLLRGLQRDLTRWLASPDLPPDMAHHLHERLSAIEHALRKPEMQAVELMRSAQDLEASANEAGMPPELAEEMRAQAAQISGATKGKK